MPPMLQLYLGLSWITGPLYRWLQKRRIVSGKEDASRMAERFGQTELVRPNGKLVWLHAASVGEALSLTTVIQGLLHAEPDLHLLVTTTTLTSARIVGNSLPERTVHQFSPYDTRQATRAFLRNWRPDVAVWTESELWPRLMVETKAAGIPMKLINARASQKTCRVWRRWPRTISTLLGMFDTIAVQERPLVELMQEIGVPCDRIILTGSTKENAAPLSCDVVELESLQSRIAKRPLWLAASTHKGEEEIGPVTFLCRSKCSFKPLSFRKRRVFSSPVLSVDVMDCRSR
jgi:3-deoxy-D-manno-octulosonic-acid transferase